MPTPFTHLRVAHRMREHPNMRPNVVEFLDANWAAFYLGNVAPDYQTISDAPREATHFYELPPRRDTEAHQVMIQRYPQLGAASQMDAEQASFIAGYRAHLLLDLRWYWQVLTPYFVEAEDWPADHRQRFLAHNILLTYLDREAAGLLPPEAASMLTEAEPRHWLPFAGDGDLIRWRDMLAEQLEPDAQLATISIYASRMRLSPEEFAGCLEDPAWMQRQLFSKVPLANVRATISSAVDQSVALVSDYLAPAV